MIVEIVVIFISILAFFDYLMKKHQYDNTVNVPGPRIFPFIGNLFFLKQKNSADVMRNIIHYTEIYGPIVRVWGGNRMYVVTLDPKDVEVIQGSSKFITKGLNYKSLVPWLRDGLLLTSGQKWHQRRKILTQTYHFKILEQFIEVFDQQSDILVKKLVVFANEKAFDVYPFITSAALDVIAETAMSTKLNAQSHSNSEYVSAVNQMTEIAMNRMSNVFYNFDVLFKVFAPGMARRQEKLRKVLHDFTDNIIKRRRNELCSQNGNLGNDEITEGVGVKRKIAFLDLLLQANVNGKPLSDVDIGEEVDTFMFEGHDTTASGLSFCLYCLSRNKDAQDKLVDEIKNVLANHRSEPLNLTLLQELKYMELVIKEAFRLYPPVPIISRLTLEDTFINGRKIPKHVNIILPIFAIQKNPDYFPDPDSFLPERHSIDSHDTIQFSPFAFIPFSAGPRNCIGQKFAMLEVKSMLLKILSNYELLPMGNEPKVEMNLIMRSMNGINLAMRPRVSF